MAGENFKQCRKKQTVNTYFIVVNDRGMHTRPAAELVKCACKFKSQISLSHHRNTVNGKSLLGVLTLAATKGTKIQLQAVGEDAEAAAAAILSLAESQFNIKY